MWDLKSKISELRIQDNQHIVEETLEVAYKMKQEKGRNTRAIWAFVVIGILGLFALAGTISLAAMGGSNADNLFYTNQVLVGGVPVVGLTGVSTITEAGQLFQGFVYGAWAVATILTAIFALVDKVQADKEDVEIAESEFRNDVKNGMNTHNLKKEINAIVHDSEKNNERLARLEKISNIK